MSWDYAFAHRYDEWDRFVAGDARASARPSCRGQCGARPARRRTWGDRRRTFERVAASLRPGGGFAWNAFAFDHRIAVQLDGEHEDEPVPHTTRYAVGDNRIDITLDEGATSSLWWATKNEWLGLIDVTGLDLDAVLGGFDGEPFDDDTREYVFVARRPVGGWSGSEQSG
jgi:hypothetical protein